MTAAISIPVTLVVAVLAWFGASAAPGSAPAPRPAAPVLVLQAPQGALAPTAAQVRAARATARRLAPGVPARVRVVTGPADAQAVVARAAAAAPGRLLVVDGPDAGAAAGSAAAAWPSLRVVPAGR